MGVEVRPLGVKCNIKCQYCYQNPQRNAEKIQSEYDMAAIKAAIVQIGRPFSLFGGEPLLVPLADLEELFSFGFKMFGENGIQTNGTLISDRHIQLFRLYNVKVGLSIDGPADLNRVRSAGSTAATDRMTSRIEGAIRRLCDAGIIPSIIVTLHRNNATADKWPRMDEWISSLDRLGIRRLRLHILELDNPEYDKELLMSDEENIEALLHFASLENTFTHVRFDLFSEMRSMLLGQDEGTSCVWHACDPYTTEAVQGVEGSGRLSNCGRTNKDGIDFVKSDAVGYERQIALYQTPQWSGGCKGCRFFLMCKGNCPGTSDDGDWRNRSKYCSVWMSLYDHFESELIRAEETPLSIAPDRERIEAILLDEWALGRNPTIAVLWEIVKNETVTEIGA